MANTVKDCQSLICQSRLLFPFVLDFQKAAALVHEFLLKLGYESECSELRDALNLALLHMQRYYRLLRTRMQNIDKTSGSILAQSLRGLSPMTPFKDAPDKFQWRWLHLDNPKFANHLPADVNKDIARLPPLVQAAKDGNNEQIMQLLDNGEFYKCTLCLCS